MVHVVVVISFHGWKMDFVQEALEMKWFQVALVLEWFQEALELELFQVLLGLGGTIAK